MRTQRQHGSAERVGRHPDADILKLYRELTSAWKPWITLNTTQQRLVADILQEHYRSIEQESRNLKNAQWAGAAKALCLVAGVVFFLIIILVMGGAL